MNLQAGSDHNMPRRSRGCQACRQRRIGCDATLPCCRQCLLTNRSCSGPIRGAIILDQTGIVTARHRRTSTPPNQGETPAMGAQPSPRAFISLAFVSHFIYFITAGDGGASKRTWLHALGDVSRGENGPALDLALQAAATAFCGVISKNYTVLVEACQLYGKALSRYIGAMSQRSEAPITSKICISALLSLYEAIWPTNSSAYIVHLAACWKILASAGSEPEDIAVLKQVATHVQYQTVCAALRCRCSCITDHALAICRNRCAQFLSRFDLGWGHLDCYNLGPNRQDSASCRPACGGTVWAPETALSKPSSGRRCHCPLPRHRQKGRQPMGRIPSGGKPTGRAYRVTLPRQFSVPRWVYCFDSSVFFGYLDSPLQSPLTTR